MKLANVFLCIVAGLLLTGCAASQQSIREAVGNLREIELGAREAMLIGDHGIADYLYARASQRLNQSEKTYVDGYLYLDNARMRGNRALMALFDGEVGRAKHHFSASSHFLDSGVEAHKAKLQKRKSLGQGIAGVVAAGAVVGILVQQHNVQKEGNLTQDQTRALDDAVESAMELTTDTFVKISQHLDEIHRIRVDEQAQDVDKDKWRAAVISDHPLSRAIVKVKSPGSYCTGFFIQPRVVATAAHCFDRGEPVEVYAPDARNSEGFLLNNSILFKNQTVAAYQPESYDGSTCHVDDLALIVVRNPSEYWLEIDKQTAIEQSNGMVIGYSGDLDGGFFQRIDYGCELSHEWNEMLADNCATYPGNSGGPLFSVDYKRKHDPFRVAGVVSCGRSDQQGERTAGKGNWGASIYRLEKLYREVISLHPDAGDEGLFEPNWIFADNQPCQVHNPFPVPGETITWSGGCVNGKASGTGRLVWRNKYGTGSQEGEYREGKRHGRGVAIWPGGRYEGDYRGDKRHGHGMLALADGFRYKGQWRNDKYHGRGTMMWADGSRYEGEHSNGKPHGQGIATLVSGNRYEGQWHSGCFKQDRRFVWVLTTREACGF